MESKVYKGVIADISDGTMEFTVPMVGEFNFGPTAKQFIRELGIVTGDAIVFSNDSKLLPKRGKAIELNYERMHGDIFASYLTVDDEPVRLCVGDLKKFFPEIPAKIFFKIIKAKAK